MVLNSSYRTSRPRSRQLQSLGLVLDEISNVRGLVSVSA